MIKSTSRIDQAIAAYCLKQSPEEHEKARLKLLRAAWESGLKGDRTLELEVYMGFALVVAFEKLSG